LSYASADRAQIPRHQSSLIRNPTSLPRSSSKEEMNRRSRRWINRKRCLPQHCLHCFAADFKSFLERNVTIRAATRSERTQMKYYKQFHIREINFIFIFNNKQEKDRNCNKQCLGRIGMTPVRNEGVPGLNPSWSNILFANYCKFFTLILIILILYSNFNNIDYNID